MRTPRSDRFDVVIRGSHQIRTVVDVLYAGAEVATDLPVISGSYEADRTKAVLASISNLTVIAPHLAPQRTGALTPFGYELRVRRGVVYADGTEELLPLGVFPIQTSSTDGAFLSSSIKAFDRSQLVIDARLEDDYAIAAGTNYADAIRLLILDGVPSATFNLPSTSFTTPALVVPVGSDRWAYAQQMATACGWELYADSEGRYAARVEPSVSSTTSVWTIDEGPTGVLMGVNVSLDRAPAYNKVVCSGENTALGAVFRGEAADLDPTSPSYYLGGFGRKPMFQASPFYTGDAQCSIAAQAMLDRVRGVARALSLTAVPNPALEAGDAITVRRSALGIDEVHIIDSLTMGLAATDMMSLATRTVR